MRTLRRSQVPQFEGAPAFHLDSGIVGFGDNSPLPSFWIVATVSLGLGSIDIDQAVVSAIADMIAAKVTIIRITPASGVDQPPH